ncbi:MAG: FAD-dependent monooxygenase [Proteobacteria bacterium]|nr:FAD-dependent monooxygenase [Pseudomonadota bacterium]
MRAFYLAGCGGNSSRVRKTLDIKLDGRGSFRNLVRVIFKSDELYDHIKTGKGCHCNFADTAGSSLDCTRLSYGIHSAFDAPAGDRSRPPRFGHPSWTTSTSPCPWPAQPSSNTEDPSSSVPL